MITCFVDGSCIGNGKRGAVAGYAAVFPDHPTFNVSERLSGMGQTNNRAEYTAFIRACEQATLIDPLCEQEMVIYTDSKLLMDSVTKWLPNWKRNGFVKADKKQVLNQDLLKRIDELIKTRRVRWNHVRAHTGRHDFASIYNDQADKLAKLGAQKT